MVRALPAPPPASGEPTTPPTSESGLLKVPYISQFRPAGAGADDINGGSNCGPTSMAMIGRYYGYGSGMTDAQLVTHLNLADGKATGATNADGIKKMGATLGEPVAHRLGADFAFVDQALAAGKPVAARGIFTSVRHYIVVTGKNAQGNYTVNDPASSSRKVLTPEQLSAFIRKHPEGAFFSVG